MVPPAAVQVWLKGAAKVPVPGVAGVQEMVGAELTVKLAGKVDDPPLVVTVASRAVKAAPEAILIMADHGPVPDTVAGAGVMPVPVKDSVPAVKLDPPRVTVRLCAPRPPIVGAIEVNEGAAAVTVIASTHAAVVTPADVRVSKVYVPEGTEFGKVPETVVVV